MQGEQTTRWLISLIGVGALSPHRWPALDAS